MQACVAAATAATTATRMEAGDHDDRAATYVYSVVMFYLFIGYNKHRDAISTTINIVVSRSSAYQQRGLV